MVDPQGYALVITLNDGLIWEVTNSMWANPGIVNIDTPYRLNHHIYYSVAGDISPRGNEILILTKHQIYILLNVHLQYNYKGAMSTGVSHTLYEGSFYLGMKEICLDKDSLNLRYSGRAIQTYRLLCSPLLNRIELWRAEQQVAIKKSICNPFF